MKSESKSDLSTNQPEWVCTKPTVELAACTELDETFYASRMAKSHLNHGSYDFVSQEDGELLVEFGGRVCYQSHHNPAHRTSKEYIENILKQKHYSVTRHAVATFYLEGVSRAFTHELVRHHHHDPSQLSQRYVDQTTLRFVCPPLLRNFTGIALPVYELWEDTVGTARLNYEKLVAELESQHKNLPRKQIREAARSVMPECIETKVLVTANVQAWREFLEKRWNSHADAEMIEVSAVIASILKAKYPSLFNDITYQD